MGLFDAYRNRSDRSRDRGRTSIAAALSAMSDPSYARLGMLGPMLAAGGGAASLARRQDDLDYERRMAEEEERRHREEIEAQERQGMAEERRLRLEGLQEDLKHARTEEERSAAYRTFLRLEGVDPDNPARVKVYEQRVLAEESPKDPDADLRRRATELQIQLSERSLRRPGPEREDKLIKAGDAYGYSIEDPSTPSGHRFEPLVPGKEEAPDDSEANDFIIKRAAQLQQGLSMKSFEEAIDQAIKDWEGLQRRLHPQPRSNLERLQEQADRRNRAFAARLPEGAPVAGVVAFGKKEAAPVAGSAKFIAGSTSDVDRQLDELLAGRPGPAAARARADVKAAIAAGEDPESVLNELRMALGR